MYALVLIVQARRASVDGAIAAVQPPQRHRRSAPVLAAAQWRRRGENGRFGDV